MKDHVTLKAEHSQNFPTMLSLSKHCKTYMENILETFKKLLNYFLSPVSYEVMNITPYESLCARSQEVTHSAVF